MTTASAQASTQVLAAAQGGAAAAAPSGPGGPGKPSGPGGPSEPAKPVRSRTDRRLVRLRASLAVGALLFGAAGIIGTQVRADGADDAKAHSGVMIQQAEQLYHSLSDADATSTTIYLHVGEAPADLLGTYNSDLQKAQAALLAATNEAGDDAAAKKALGAVASQLPQYVKLNATAAANNLLGYPVGFRYLTQASNLMQGTILPAAQSLTDTEAKNLASAEDTAKQFPFLMTVFGVLLLFALLMVQVRESRRTNRVFNVGLLAATAALVLSFAWTGIDVTVQNGHEDDARKRGSDQVSALATARILSLQARTDEMLTLVGRGTADDKETDYAGVTAASGTHTPGTEELLAAKLHDAVGIATDDTGKNLAQHAASDESSWHTLHLALRASDAQNQYQKAVDSALGQHDFAAPKPSAAASFTALQADLDQAIKHAEASFQSEADSGASALAGLEIGLGLLALAMAAAVLRGLGRRIAEYH
ncbi:secreted protein [Catenulispora acidiphila DSM 44928]|uniref:Secreted protein n=1 Tax=Catenulispora acidiphila (strain DSM 44928 / JCM 14897 / NBRC 102108 / NRRL B-24433 / ID139908) TaxID=479433 RepID=C7QHQ2_CATAD|nr:hypothetical protein [Catenulispora acidiphila]ACU71077.1 secreted protein [Catenulispora acidiphila DSM 44928]